MRVLLDANIYISYLLRVSEASAVHRIVDAVLREVFVLLVPDELLQELTRKVTTKRYLARRISQSTLEGLVDLLVYTGEPLSPITEEIPAISRDRKDDYLLAYALIGAADYLVTGDADLLVLKEIEGVRIITPATFLEVLKNLPPSTEH